MNNKICKISLFSLILASVATMPVDGAVKTKNSNRSYADAYNQVNALRYQQEYLAATATNATTASATENLPVMVADEKLASAILNNTSELVSMSDLENCSMIYPNGVFRWDIPESGIRRNQTNQCVAVVSLIDANTNAVLATTTLAAGDSFKCNIDNFPESGMNRAIVEKTYLPADSAPTMEDVEAVMNEEQRQNAGFKIAAGAILAGVAGNVLAKNEAGSTSMFGTNKDKLIGTAAGVAAGAGIMAASSYSGKVAGDTINSVAVNAASGMIVGNMLAGANGGDGYLDIQTCNIEKATDENYKGEHDCIIGTYEIKGNTLTKQQQEDGTNYDFFIINKQKVVKACKRDQDQENKFKCDPYNKSLVDIELTGSAEKFEKIFTEKNSEIFKLTGYKVVEGNDTTFEEIENLNSTTLANDTYYKIEKAFTTTGEKRHAYIVFQNKVAPNIKGYKSSDLDTLKTNYNGAYFLRNSNGSVGDMVTADKDKIRFTPKSKDAEDGGLVDLNNKARAKGTAVGATAGGAMGGFAGYEGAKSEITDRWTAAVREYEDSLSNFVCMTGTRYLSKYNDYVEIPELKKSEQ